ncbi:hypothetical protein CHLRE_02g076900v5 [Chlamydomonas reinhardtii]|uniref:cGMP-dependent protein kinase n=1 Tax=Chlamydomonas reinhardtii TaxID=3055 RepID=Q695H0_CHLRE|nr:uncharacterized protein CHLRE_02g076900v5 [Chlamydomonas reinhardtii]AAT81143.1 cGMP-dependent protein kinase [Chlamydomonas reinhardtii]PNW86201.1 hypothetical protein CHLRE_02g076900v5 [Chlamydomonas reinhardtii]|eukprot:XP_001701644.1 cGMP-dependent protein kinase [Chlamydomonas reinhardtii]
MGCAQSTPVDQPARQQPQATQQKSVEPAVVKKPVEPARVEPKVEVPSTKPSEVPHVEKAQSINRGQPGDGSGPLQQPSPAMPGAKQGGTKERRAAAGSEAVRDQIRKLAVGGPQAKEEKEKIYEVSDSEDEELEDDPSERTTLSGDWYKPQEVTDAILEALKRNFVFKGIPQNHLVEVVGRMYGISFKSGAVVLQQGALPKQDDCMYYLQQGEAEVVISGGADASKNHGEERKVDGHTVRIPQKPGWLFGDVALLFHSPRTASVVAKTNITVWAMDRRTFLKFVMKHAQGARALRFLRKLPLLKGLSDNDLIRAASRMPQRMYEDGQPLIRIGERGDELFLIRYGKVRVFRPDGNGGRVEVAVLGRGQFVGERAVINDKLRSADCVAQGQVQVVVLKKREFMDLDNPLLAWMLDYDAVSAVIRSLPQFKGLKQEQMENILDRFDAREELMQGDTILNQGDMLEKLYVVKIGEIALFRNDERVEDPNFVHEIAGFSYFGETAITQTGKCPYTIRVASESLHLLSLPKRQVDSFMGRDTGLKNEEAVVAALKKSKFLANMTDPEFKELLKACEQTDYNPGEVIAVANSSVTNKIFLVKSGEVMVVAADLALPDTGEVDVRKLTGSERQRLLAGSIFNDKALNSPETASLEASLVAGTPCGIITFTTSDVERVMGGRAMSRSRNAMPGAAAAVEERKFPRVKFTELEFHRIIGTGQFGLVRVVRNIKTNEVYALKVMHKAPIVESKQIEHVINERKILEEACTHPFCVRLCGAYQDKASLYLLQEWVPGGELFHHLDVEGAFDEPTAMFYAANVLLALEFLHAKGIVYRDLKPENLLLDTQGYIKMADFGFAKYIGGDKTYTICGTPDYQAPEVIMRRGTTKAADYWALGVLIFEMLVGDPPFKSLTGDPWDTFRRTLSGRFYVPNFISDQAADLIFKLLQVNPDKRLGSDKRLGAEEIKRHRWFSRIDWRALEQKKLPSPFRPRVRNPLDTSNFDNFDNVDLEPPPVPADRAEKHSQQWELWDWIDDSK